MPHTDVIPTSASSASVGLGLRYIGRHCYAYSGTFQSVTTSAIMLEFQTGSGYIVGDLTCNGSIKFSDAAGGDVTAWKITINGEVSALLKTESGLEEQPMQVVQTFVLPPLTTFKLERDGVANNTAHLNTATFTGRVYGAE